MKIKKKIIKIMDFLMLDCKQASFLISKKLDGKLNFKEKLQLKSHLLYCDFCNKFDKQSKKIDEIIKITPEKMDEKHIKKPVLDKKIKNEIVNELKNQ